MNIYNTSSKKKEPFIPRVEGKVSLYVCGITAYDYSHIGHARSAVVFDILFRFYTFSGLDVLFIRNFTDVDDKIIAKSKQENRSCIEVSEKFIKAYHEDLDMLNVLRPTIEPKATEHIDDMIQCIEALIASASAYSTSSGNVYYRVRSSAHYGDLSGHNIDSLYENVRIENNPEKEDSLDFALWKSAKEGEPYWESPWGNGRPGWHIECTAMSKKYAELPLDIHGGGIDLVFPHHENEKAQTESICKCTFVKYWMHNGFVQIDSEKMSKSLNNFTIIRDIYKEFLPEVLRYFLITKHYRTPIDFSFEGLVEAEKNLRTIYSIKKFAEEYLLEKTIQPEDEESILFIEYTKYYDDFFIAMNDDMNTASALGHVFSIVNLISRIMHTKKTLAEYDYIIARFVKDIKIFSEILGVFTENTQDFLEKLRTKVIERKKIDTIEIDNLIHERLEARKNKNFTRADEIRIILLEKGICIKDTVDSTIWDIE